MVYISYRTIIILGSILGFGKIKGNEQHRTKQAAAEKQPDLSCYRCDTMVDGKQCENLNVTDNNSSIFQQKCQNDHRICKVKKISMSTSTEDAPGKLELWLLQRNCTKSCEEGCIIIGERTKLYSCTSCCETNLCNMGSSTENLRPYKQFLTLFLSIAYLLKYFLL